jgi:hypothetical protein
VSGRNRAIVVHAISEQAKAFAADPSPAEPMPPGVRAPVCAAYRWNDEVETNPEFEKLI